MTVINNNISVNICMSRRSVSPIRFRGEGDPRDNIIRKLKEDIIVAKGK